MFYLLNSCIQQKNVNWDFKYTSFYKLLSELITQIWVVNKIVVRDEEQNDTNTLTKNPNIWVFRLDISVSVGSSSASNL